MPSNSFLTINFYNQHRFDLNRLDPMQPMDLGDGPELLELTITLPRYASETAWNPFFGVHSNYTGSLSDGNTSRPVFIKWARSKQRMKELEEEGNFYCSSLRKLQGVAVPKFYGYYASMAQETRGIGCMILEKMDEGDILSWEIDNRSKLEAAYRLHKFGIRHYGLHEQESFVMHGDKVYIVGFSGARVRCGCKMTRDCVRLCSELKHMEQQFGDGGTNNVLKEIGVPRGWRVCLK